MSKGTINKVFLIGRLGADPELRNTAAGTTVATFSIATNHSVKSENEWTEKTEWHNIVLFGKSAELAGQLLEKGKLIYIEGRLQTNSWTDQDDQKKSRTEIIANDFQLVGSAPGKRPESNSDEPSEEDKDLPF